VDEASEGPPRGLSAWLGAFFVFFDVVIRRVDGKTKTDHRTTESKEIKHKTSLVLVFMRSMVWFKNSSNHFA